MIQVEIDDEIVKEFKDKVFRNNIGLFVPGTMLYLDGFWRYGGGSLLTFFQIEHDNEFTEWLKEHRPEVFL